MTVEGKEEKDDILIQEIQSWKGFEYSLRVENSSLFNMMLTECQDNEQEYSSKFC
jgi:hypothetical protein